MPRKNYTEQEINEVLHLYRSLERTGHHRRIGVKGHMVRTMQNMGYINLSHKDINNILDILKKRMEIGDHHCHAHTEPPTRKGRGFVSALQNDYLRSVVSLPSGRNITPGTHRILAIPDAHACVSLTNERFMWAGKLAAEQKVDYVVQVGDWCSWDSLSGHEKPGSLRYAQKPTFDQEYAVFLDSLQQFKEGMGDHKASLHCHFGNHEQRLYVYENLNPVVAGMLSGKVENAYRSFGWATEPYGKRAFVEGVMFVHRPLHVMNNAKSNAAVKRDADCDIYMCHDHKSYKEVVVKATGTYTIISGGVFLPQGYEPSYVGYSETGWWYGCQILTVENGKIADVQEISMKRLEERYA